MKPQADSTAAHIEALLAAYDHDVEKAIAAVRQHDAMQLQHQSSNTPPRPLGKVIAQVVGLQKSYKLGKQTIPALSGADLTVYEGEFVALTGPSGSGKSTLLQLIGGLDKPTSGSIVVDGVDIAKLSDTALSHFRNTTIGFVFQFFYLQPFLSLARNIEVPAMFAGGDRRARQQRVASLLEQVGLSDRATHLPKELSGGQMQRAAIARALLNQPKLLLADEPTGNLDSANSQSIVDLFDDIRTKYGTTIIVVTHDRSIARRADRTVSLVDGKVAA